MSYDDWKLATPPENEPFEEGMTRSEAFRMLQNAEDKVKDISKSDQPKYTGIDGDKNRMIDFIRWEAVRMRVEKYCRNK